MVREIGKLLGKSPPGQYFPKREICREIDKVVLWTKKYINDILTLQSIQRILFREIHEIYKFI